MKVSKAIQFPEVVQVDHPVLPESRNLTERPNDAAALRVRLPDHRHAAAPANARGDRLLHAGQGQRNGAPPHTQPGHLSNKTLTIPNGFSGSLAASLSNKAAGGWSTKSALLFVLIKALPY